jgi:hypothetical protein
MESAFEGGVEETDEMAALDETDFREALVEGELEEIFGSEVAFASAIEALKGGVGLETRSLAEGLAGKLDVDFGLADVDE